MDSTLLFYFFFFLLLLPSKSTPLPTPKHTTTFQPQSNLVLSQSQPPTTYFEVTRPPPLPPSHTSLLLLHHTFAYTYQLPPVTSPYTPPSHPHSPSKVLLTWSASSRGRQFDRIFGVWLGGVELLRSCTAEPRPTGIVWTVRKDISKYISLLSQPNTLAVYLGNLVDDTYTGVYNVNLTFHFYYDDAKRRRNSGEFPADLVVPVSRSLPLKDGLWFPVGNSSVGKEIVIPRNAYRAVLEVYVSFHASDEFWYTNPPNEYIEANELGGTAGNGPFREVRVSVDGDLVGVVWPFTVVYTGGVNPLLWRPITGIGSFDLPSYDVEITPFLGQLLDGKTHEFAFGVTNALDVWYIDANLHVWLDKKRSRTTGKLVKHKVPKFAPSLVSKFKGLDGTFLTTGSRRISASGWVKSSHGKITTHVSQHLKYKNFMEFKGNGSVQVINQIIDWESGVRIKNSSAVLYSERVTRRFPLYLYTGIENQKNETYDSVSNISFSFNEKRVASKGFGLSYSLENKQDAQGDMVVKGNLVQSGIGSTQQEYRYEGTDGCYFRNVSSRNYTIPHDDSGELCSKRSKDISGKLFTTECPISTRRTSLESDKIQVKSTDGKN